MRKCEEFNEKNLTKRTSAGGASAKWCVATMAPFTLEPTQTLQIATHLIRNLHTQQTLNKRSANMMEQIGTVVMAILWLSFLKL